MEEFGYDWTKPISQTALDFASFVWRNLLDYQTNSVYVVAHSMGGLIVRSYMQSTYYSFDIEKLVMAGTPHKGSLDSFFTWEAGNFKDFGPAIAAFEPFLDTMKVAYDEEESSDRAFVQEYIPTVNSLLPVFPYYQYNGREIGEGDFVQHVEMCESNQFLSELNADVDVFLTRDTDIYVLGGTDKKTLEFFSHKKSPVVDCPTDEDWPDRKPKRHKSENGDGTVLVDSTFPNEDLFSSHPIDSSRVKFVPVKHNKLLRNKDAIDEVLDFLSD